METIQIVGLASIALLVLLNGFFVAAEYALVTVRWTRIEELVELRRLGALAAREAKEHLDSAIAAAQLGVTFASLGLGWLGEPSIAHLIEPAFQGAPGPFSVVVRHGVAVAIAFLFISYLHVVLGELAPKAIALQRAEDVALWVAGPLLAFGRFFRPLTWSMKMSGRWVVRLLRLPPLPDSRLAHSIQELGMLSRRPRRPA